MIRYFYPASRTHHAYCMARDFGMEFERRFGKWEPEGLLHIDPASSYRIYIHPDSLHLLVPLDDDGLYGPCGGELVSVGHFSGDYTIEQAKHAVSVGWHVIQRDGLPFHWPEVEP